MFAYIDPGTGSVIAQAIIGGIVGIGAIMKVYWHKISKIFGKTNTSTSKDLRGKEPTNEPKTK